MRADRPMTATDVRDRLQVIGFDSSKYASILSAIHTIPSGCTRRATRGSSRASPATTRTNGPAATASRSINRSTPTFRSKCSIPTRRSGGRNERPQRRCQRAARQSADGRAGSVADGVASAA
jgi:hypothetical protein